MPPIFRSPSVPLPGPATGVMLATPAADGTAHAQPADTHELRVNVLGLQSDQGQAVAKLYREGEDIFSLPGLQMVQTITARKAMIVFKDLAPGHYAIVVFHDVNGNGQLDHNLLRLPAEPLGFSNGFQLGLLSGKPDSHKLAFAIGAGDLAIDITVR